MNSGCSSLTRRTLGRILLGMILSASAASQDDISWVWEEPFPVGSNLRAVWGSGPGDVHVAGDSGGLGHFDGLDWRVVETGINHSFAGLHGFGPGDLYLTGHDNHEIASYRSGVTYRYDGQQLTLMPMEFSGGRPNTAIWGSSDVDLIVAVTQTSGSACPQFYDGIDWAPDCTIPRGNQLSVAGFGSADAYFGQQGQFVRLDRSTGLYTAYPLSGSVSGIWVSQSNLVFLATGGELVRFDGELQPGLAVTGGARDVWGSADNDVWVVGDRIHRYDGAQLTEYPRPDGTSNELLDVWGTGSADVFAVGEAGTILHFDGDLWQRQAGAQAYAANNSGAGWQSLGGTQANGLLAGAGDLFQRVDGQWQPLERFDMSGRVRDVWAAGNDDVWAVGDQVWYWDGNAAGDWTVIDNPTSVPLNRVHGIGASDFYIAGDDAKLLHYDGQQFTPVSLPDIGGVDLNDVWMAAADRVFVAGDAGTILLYDGINWGIHSIPDLMVSTDAITALWGEVVNTTINVFAATSGGQILHWPGGGSWDVVETGLPVRSRSFGGLWGVRTETSFDLFAVGRAGSSTQLVVHQRGGVWSETEPATASGSLRDVVGTGPDQVFAVDGTRSDILRFDGAQWSEDVFPGPDFNVELWGLGVLPDQKVIAGGRDFMLIHTGQWQMMARPVSDIGDFPDLMRTPDGRIYATGSNGCCSWDTYHHNGMTFQRLDYRHLENSTRCSRFWSDGVEFFVMCARNDNTSLAAVHHFDGLQWSSMNFPDQGGSDIWGADADNVFVVGGSFSSGGQIAYYDGNPAGTWVPMTVDTPGYLRHVTGFAADDVIAGGEDGVLLHYDGIDWQPMATPLPTNTFLNLDIRSLYADPGSGVALAGISGTRSLVLNRGGDWRLLSTHKTVAFLKGVWTNGATIFLATSAAEIIRGDVSAIFRDGFE